MMNAFSRPPLRPKTGWLQQAVSPIGERFRVRTLTDSDQRRVVAIDRVAYLHLKAEMWEPTQLVKVWYSQRVVGLKVTTLATDEPLGFILIAFEAERVTVLRLAIDPKWRNRGIGRHLIHDAQARDAEACRPFVAYTHEENMQAIRFLAACGYHSTGVANKGMHRDGRDDYRFVREWPTAMAVVG